MLIKLLYLDFLSILTFFFFFFSTKDCLRDAAREMAECPEVGIIQHESGAFSYLCEKQKDHDANNDAYL
jgi:hypothetical protein